MVWEIKTRESDLDLLQTNPWNPWKLLCWTMYKKIEPSIHKAMLSEQMEHLACDGEVERAPHIRAMQMVLNYNKWGFGKIAQFDIDRTYEH